METYPVRCNSSLALHETVLHVGLWVGIMVSRIAFLRTSLSRIFILGRYQYSCLLVERISGLLGR